MDLGQVIIVSLLFFSTFTIDFGYRFLAVVQVYCLVIQTD